MKLEKFPVISKTGNEYLVQINCSQSYGIEFLYCELYTRKIIKTKYLKRVKVIDIYLDKYVCVKNVTKAFDEEYMKFENNYKEFAIYTVEKYESEKEENRIKKQQKEVVRNKNIKEFNEWDGKC